MEKSPIQEIFLQTTHIDKMPCWNFQKNSHVYNSMKKKGVLQSVYSKIKAVALYWTGLENQESEILSF